MLLVQKQTKQWNRTKNPETDPTHTWSPDLWQKDTTANHWREIIFSINSVGSIYYPNGKNELWPLPHTVYKCIQKIQRQNVKQWLQEWNTECLYNTGIGKDFFKHKEHWLYKTLINFIKIKNCSWKDNTKGMKKWTTNREKIAAIHINDVCVRVKNIKNYKPIIWLTSNLN